MTEGFERMIEPGVNLASLRPDRSPDFVIGPKDDPYMLRWWLIPRNEVFNVYYHQVLHDDDDRALHDHPWPSFSILIRGLLREITMDGDRMIGPGGCVYRGPEMAHRLEVAEGPVETLFITGPRVRDWGFHCPKGFVHWQDFVGADHGEIGRGCGEMS
ncbi:MAG: hypothetical protein ACU0AU_04965 [Cognatishimia activa]